MDNSTNIRNLIRDAEKLIRRRNRWWWGSMVNYDEISEIYEKIGNLYKLDKKIELAIKYLLLAIEYAEMEGNNNKYKIYNLTIEISDMYKKLNDCENVKKYIDKASIVIGENGDFYKASKIQAELGEYLEREGENKGAIRAYKRSLEYDDKYIHSIKCLNKIAENKAIKEKYGEAIEKYKEIIKRKGGEKILWREIPEYCVSCVICYLCNDDIAGAKKLMDKICDEYPNFIGGREEEFCSKIIKEYEKMDEEEYIKGVKEYDKYKRLNKYRIEMLLRIKNHLKDDDKLL